MSDFTKVPDVRACWGCLALGCKLYDIREKRLEQVFSDLTGLPVFGGLLCGTCLYLVNKFKAFRERCRNTGYILTQPLLQNENVLITIDRTHLRVPLCRSSMCLVNFKSTRELSLSDVLHISLPKETSTMDFENDVKPEDSLENLSVSERFHNTHNNIDNIEFSHGKMKTVTNDTNNTNKITDEFANEIKLTDTIETYKILDDADDDVVKTIIDDADDNVEESVIYDADDNVESVIYDADDNVESVIYDADDNVEESVILYETDDDILETIVDDTDNSYKETVPVKSKRVQITKSKLDKNKSELTKCFTDMRKALREVDSTYYEMFERFYKFSLVKERPELSGGVLQIEPNQMTMDQTKREEHNFTKFLDLYKEIADTYQVDVEFISIVDEWRAMDGRRNSLAKDSNPYNCEKCCKLYVTSSTVERHLKRSHNENLPFRCEVCFYTFKREPALMLHLFKFHCTRKKCRKCDKTLKSVTVSEQWNEVILHMNTFHSSNLIPCQYCGLTFNSLKRSLHHVRQAHFGQMNAVQCWLCGDSYNGPFGLKSHVHRIHTEAVKCVVCGVFFQNKEAMVAHLTETCKCLENTSACPMCGATFPTESLMKAHYDDKHAKYKCEQCARSFIEYECYRVHLIKICPVDGQRLPKEKNEASIIKYNRRKKYENKKIKDGKLSFICHVCGKGFLLQCKLRYHMRLHTGEKPFKCDQCDKTFRLHSSLFIHKWMHSGERRYKCQLCSRTFRQSGHLHVHVARHFNEKKFACDMCEKRYTAKPSLKDHIQSVHMGLPLKPRRRKPKKKAAITSP